MESVITGLVSRFGYWGVLLLIAVENIFPPIPSEVILTFGGFLTTCTEMTPPGVILFSTLGSVAGAIVLYGVGRLLAQMCIRDSCCTCCSAASCPRTGCGAGWPRSTRKRRPRWGRTLSLIHICC